jgi:hypothetical protein
LLGTSKARLSQEIRLVDERKIIIERESGGSMANFSLVAVLVLVGLIALFVWQPWNTTLSTPAMKTTIAQPGAAGERNISSSGASGSTHSSATQTSGKNR